MKKAIVIGSGIAGLASALRLRRLNYDVHVFEANDFVGGKLSQFEINSYRFDKGPSLFTMPELVDELFKIWDRDPKNYFTYIRKNTVCNYFWPDGTTFSAPAQRSDFIKRACEVFSVDEPKLDRYLKKNEEKFDLTADIFLRKSLHRFSTYWSAETLKSLLQLYKLNLSSTLNEVNENYFSDPHLVQLFNRYATYNGSSPYKTPGIMSMIPHLEMDQGTYYPKGGMYQIVVSLKKLADEVGIQFHLNTPVEEILIENNNVKAVRTKKGQVDADLVMSNMDVYYTYQKLLPSVPAPKQVLKQERSSSAVIFYWGINTSFPSLDLHNILFSSDYQHEFDLIFNKKGLTDDPTVYINITSKEDDTDAPAGGENWFVMVNAPSNEGQDWKKLETTLRQNVIKKINATLNTDIEKHIEAEAIFDPVGIEEKTQSYQGALYGTSSNSKLAAFLRHPNFSNKIDGLYFCGGSVHPGGGIPLCLLSAKIATDQIPSV